MPAFNRQSWNGYYFNLNPSSFLRKVGSYFYHYIPIYLNNRHITFDLFIDYPRGATETIQYEWQIYDKKTKQIIELDSKVKHSGSIEFVKIKNKVKAVSDGKPLLKYIESSFPVPHYYYGIPKAINLGYVVDDIRCFIKMKFNIGEKEFITEPIASFNIYDADDWHKVFLELLAASVIGFIIGFFMAGAIH